MVTDEYLRAERKLGEPLAAWLRRHREDGMSWRWIAIELERISGVRASDEQLLNWQIQAEVSVTYRVDPFDLLR